MLFYLTTLIIIKYVNRIVFWFVAVVYFVYIQARYDENIKFAFDAGYVQFFVHTIFDRIIIIKNYYSYSIKFLSSFIMRFVRGCLRNPDNHDLNHSVFVL